ncbi:MAG: histidine phosphatase family protein [Janthinobacterium lividum]
MTRVDTGRPTIFILVRHGETEWNRVQRIQGHLDIALSVEGVEQARRLGRRFAERGAAAARIDQIYCSDLTRARQTAAPTAAALALPVQYTEALRERCYGEFEGFDSAQVAERWPEGYTRWQGRDPDFTAAGGETPRAFHARILALLNQLAVRHPGERVVCVTHGGVLDVAYRYLRRMSLEAPRQHRLLNASINVVGWRGASQADSGARLGRIVCWGDVAHLQGGSRDDGPAATGTPR